jgi:hypothetical protein
MIYDTFKKHTYSLAFAAALALTGLMDNTTVQAQSRDWDNDRWEDCREDDRYRNSRIYNHEQEKGYRDGLRRGQEDYRDNRRPDPNNSSHYRNGNSDYRYGFRQGYQQGFGSYGRGGYGGYDNYNREEEKGFRDGLRRGQEDARDRRIPDPNNSSHYRKGNDDYRRGFRQGYQSGYRQSAGRRIW